MFHSDRGSQYTSPTFRKLLNQLSVVQSFSGKGYVAESFFKFLKLEEINQNTYSSFADLKSSLFEYIEGFYNSKRPHSTNNFLSPNDFESAYFEKNS